MSGVLNTIRQSISALNAQLGRLADPLERSVVLRKIELLKRELAMLEAKAQGLKPKKKKGSKPKYKALPPAKDDVIGGLLADNRTTPVDAHDRSGSDGVKAHERKLNPKEQTAAAAKDLLQYEQQQQWQKGKP